MTLAPRGGAVSLFGLPVGRWTARELTGAITDAAARRRPLFVTYLNAHNVNVRSRDTRYAETLARADILYADGMSLVWASRWLCGRPLPERVSAADFFEEFCCEAARRGLRLALIGSAPGVARRCASRMSARIEGLQIPCATDGFWGRGGEFPDEAAALRAIREARPDLALVGLGVPRQELWAGRRAADLGAPVVWCVGALFEYFAGRRARAPRWMRRAGLEWAFRLALEPRRLARRYLWGNLEFLARVARERRRRRAASPRSGAHAGTDI